MKLHGFGVALAVLFLTSTLLLADNIHRRPELVKLVRKTLFPPFSDSTEHGPEDGVYYSLSQVQIDDLLRFYNDRRETFPYIVDAWDCDDMAREFLHLSRIWNVRRNPGIPFVPAVGAAYVLVDGPYDLVSSSPVVKAAHVINVILRDDGQWLFFEPQTGKLLAIEGPLLYEEVIKVVKIQL